MQGMMSLFSLNSYPAKNTAQSKSLRIHFRELVSNEELQLERLVHVVNQLGHQLQVTGLISDVK